MKANKYLLSITLLCFLTTSCSSEQGSNWVIFTEQQSKEMSVAEWYAKDGQSTGYWLPTREDAVAILDGTAAFLQSNAERFHSQGTPVWEELDNYMVQLLGITLDGRRIVYTNYFCTDAGYNWRKDFVLVMDGGKCFFQFMYDADTGEFFNLQVNGDA